MDTETKRIAALGISVVMLPIPSGSIDDTGRAILVRTYPISLLTAVVQTVSNMFGNWFLPMFS